MVKKVIDGVAIHNTLTKQSPFRNEGKTKVFRILFLNLVIERYRSALYLSNMNKSRGYMVRKAASVPESALPLIWKIKSQKRHAQILSWKKISKDLRQCSVKNSSVRSSFTDLYIVFRQNSQVVISKLRKMVTQVYLIPSVQGHSNLDRETLPI